MSIVRSCGEGAASTWEAIAQRKRAERASRIPKEWLLPDAIASNSTASPVGLPERSDLLSQREQDLTSPETHDATSLLYGLSTFAVSSTELVTAFCKRAAIAHQLTNCLTEILSEQAIARAKQLDDHRSKTGKVLGPLHGLPITFKDSFEIKGTDASIGITSLCFNHPMRNSQLYDILTGYGVIVIAKTTVPQTMLNANTDSIVFGRTVNPYNRHFGVAGSTGGEGALIALGGSALGVGTDGAGSVRMPAAVNGVIGYKPSGYRLPLDGRRVMGTGVMGTTMLGPVTVPGFLGRSVRDAALFAKLTAESKPWERDPFTYPHPWQGVSLPTARSLRIGTRLGGAGVELVDFQGPAINEVWELQKEWTELQDLSCLRDLLSREPHTEIVKATEIITKREPPPQLSIEYLHTMNARISTLVRQMHDAWNANGKPIDALLWVPAPHTAVPFDKYTYLGFTGLFNVIDWPAMVLPLEMYADKSIDEKTDLAPFNELDARIQELYNPELFHGLPLSVQLIGRRFEDERLLAISEAVHGIILEKSICT